MKISVVTASYNQGRFIGRCLDSVKKQVGVEIEHIVLDNCSTDSTKDVLDIYRLDSGNVDVKVFIEPDAGQTAAINRGFLMATGDILCWLNTDEYFTPGALKRVIEFFSSNPDVDVAYGDCVFVNADDEIVKNKREFEFSESMLLFYGCYIPSCATFIRRRVVDAGHVLDREFKVAMDYEFYVRLARAGYRFEHIPAAFSYFTWHETNISSLQFVRRAVEERIIKDRYSEVRGNYWFRGVVYSLMRYSWIGRRVLRRVYRRCAK